ncbi:DUF3797 domain-containing protein [uncultured Dysosmobacter sp.]|uniref:DUF3797 domain-containing protein n=1 Tax=uncultured Dysosmobacter sp. TaxID=2591384 RepID=UPI00341F3253
MELDVTIKLIRLFGRCPNCGNDMVGPNDGLLDITDHTFTRTCTCGWTVTVEEHGRRL